MGLRIAPRDSFSEGRCFAALAIFRAIYGVDVPRKPPLSHFGVSPQAIWRPLSHIDRP
jgi:hypothetical protein